MFVNSLPSVHSYVKVEISSSAVVRLLNAKFSLQVIVAVISVDVELTSKDMTALSAGDARRLKFHSVQGAAGKIKKY